jgi:oligosaccharide repeat unit polymerase
LLVSQKEQVAQVSRALVFNPLYAHPQPRFRHSAHNALGTLCLFDVDGLAQDDLVLMVKIMRPGVKIADLGDYVFIYAGAPVVNLNNWLIKASGKAHLTRIGGQTFRYMYNYLGKWTGNKKMQTYASINKFAFSANKKEIGNVYTCYYLLIYDFSYIGAAVMTAVMAWYYTHQYSRFVTAQKLFRFDPQLYIYSYLFNDLVMSFFSARFYETTVNPDFIKFVFASFIIYWIWRFSLKIQKREVLQGKE